jgi:hypothetical protein
MIITFINNGFNRFGVWRIATSVMALCFTLFITQITELNNAGIFFILMVCVSLPLNIFAVGLGKLIAEQNTKLTSRDFAIYTSIAVIITSIVAPGLNWALQQPTSFQLFDSVIIVTSSAIATVSYLLLQRKIAVIKDFPVARIYFNQTSTSIIFASVAAIFLETPVIWLLCYWSSQIFTILVLELKYKSSVLGKAVSGLSESFSPKLLIQFFYTGITLYLIQFTLTNYHRISFGSNTELVAIVHIAITPVTSLLIIIDRYFYETYGKKVLQKDSITKTSHSRLMSLYFTYQIIALFAGSCASTAILFFMFDNNFSNTLIIINFVLTCNFCFLVLVQYRQTYANLMKRNKQLNKLNFGILVLFTLMLFWSKSHNLQIEHITMLVGILGLVYLISEQHLLRRHAVNLGFVILSMASLNILTYFM